MVEFGRWVAGLISAVLAGLIVFWFTYSRPEPPVVIYPPQAPMSQPAPALDAPAYEPPPPIESEAAPMFDTPPAESSPEPAPEQPVVN